MLASSYQDASCYLKDWQKEQMASTGKRTCRTKTTGHMFQHMQGGAAGWKKKKRKSVSVCVCGGGKRVPE